MREGRGGWNLRRQLGAEFGKMRYNLRLTQDSGSTSVEYGDALRSKVLQD